MSDLEQRLRGFCASTRGDEYPPRWIALSHVEADALLRRLSKLEQERDRAVALALVHGDWESKITEAIPQTVWDALFAEGLLALGSDLSGEGYPFVTDKGKEALRAALSSEGARDA